MILQSTQKIKDQVNEEEYTAKRASLLKDKSNINIKLDENDQRVDEWLKPIENLLYNGVCQDGLPR